MNFERYGGRRFLLCLGTLFTCTALLWFGQMSDGIYRDILIATVGIYVAGNVGQRHIEKKGTE